MNKVYNYKITAIIVLLLALVGCKNPSQDIKVVVNMDLMKYSALLQISDENGAAPQNITLTMGGAAGSDIYEISGKKAFPVKDGIITLGLGPSVTPPTTQHDVDFTITVSAPGYQTFTQPVAFKNGEMQQVVMVTLQKTPAITAPATNPETAAAAPTTPAATTPATSAPATNTPATATLTPVVTTPATTTTPVTTVPATTTPVVSTPVTTTPVTAAPTVTTPAKSAPVTTTPVVTAPVTTSPVVTTPAASTPVTTAPVVAASPVNITLDFTGYCSNRPNLQIRPSLYLFYRLKDSGAPFALLGFMKDGHLDTKLLFNRVYDFQITYAGVNYNLTGRIEQTSYQSTFDMGSSVCATF